MIKNINNWEIWENIQKFSIIPATFVLNRKFFFSPLKLACGLKSCPYPSPAECLNFSPHSLLLCKLHLLTMPALWMVKQFNVFSLISIWHSA